QREQRTETKADPKFGTDTRAQPVAQPRGSPRAPKPRQHRNLHGNGYEPRRNGELLEVLRRSRARRVYQCKGRLREQRVSGNRIDDEVKRIGSSGHVFAVARSQPSACATTGS